MDSKIRKIAQIDSIIYFIVCILSALYIADFPPPPGFILVIIGISISTVIVYKYCLFIVRKMCLKEKNIFIKTISHGAIFGFILGLIFCLLPNGEPSIEGKHTLYDYLILLMVTIVVNIIVAISIYIFNLILLRIKRKY